MYEVDLCHHHDIVPLTDNDQHPVGYSWVEINGLSPLSQLTCFFRSQSVSKAKLLWAPITVWKESFSGLWQLQILRALHQRVSASSTLTDSSKEIIWERPINNFLTFHCHNQKKKSTRKTLKRLRQKQSKFLWMITLRKSLRGRNHLNGCPCGPRGNSMKWICSANILFSCERHTTKSPKTNKGARIKHDHFHKTILFPQPRQKECNQMLLLWLFVDSWSHPSHSREAGGGKWSIPKQKSVGEPEKKHRGA